MKLNYLTALGAALLMGCAASAPREYSGEPEPANETEVAAVAEVETDADKGSDLICKRERPIGSNMIKKTCYTRAQMDELTRRTQDEMYRQNQAAGCVECGGGGGGG